MITKYVENMALVSKDELQLVCKPCHGIISHSQRKGISFEEAKIEKEIIALCKDDKKVVDKLVLKILPSMFVCFTLITVLLFIVDSISV